MAPCGTPAAYRRHLRNGEEACAACRAAHDDANRARLDGDRATRQVAVLPAMPVATVDPRADALDNLSVVIAALDAAVPREVAALSKRRQELVAFIASLDSGTEATGLGDELAAFRARRAGA